MDGEVGFGVALRMGKQGIGRLQICEGEIFNILDVNLNVKVRPLDIYNRFFRCFFVHIHPQNLSGSMD